MLFITFHEHPEESCYMKIVQQYDKEYTGDFVALEI